MKHKFQNQLNFNKLISLHNPLRDYQFLKLLPDIIQKETRIENFHLNLICLRSQQWIMLIVQVDKLQRI